MKFIVNVVVDLDALKMIGFDTFNSAVVYPAVNNVDLGVLVPATRPNGEFGAINAVAPSIILVTMRVVLIPA